MFVTEYVVNLKQPAASNNAYSNASPVKSNVQAKDTNDNYYNIYELVVCVRKRPYSLKLGTALEYSVNIIF